MCGILDWASIGSPNFDTPMFEGALRQLAHCGPDDQGIWSEAGVMLGHRRLSIIDLSTAGHQPMPSSSGRSHIGPLHAWCDPTRLARLFEVNRKGVMGSEHHLYKLVSTQMWMDRSLTTGDVA